MCTFVIDTGCMRVILNAILIFAVFARLECFSFEAWLCGQRKEERGFCDSPRYCDIGYNVL